MSKIITPRDQIVIDIDNTKNPPQANVSMSRLLPSPFVAGILAQIIVGLMQNTMNQLTEKLPPLPGEKTDA